MVAPNNPPPHLIWTCARLRQVRLAGRSGARDEACASLRRVGIWPIVGLRARREVEMQLSRAELIQAYSTMSTIRAFEEKMHI